MTFKENFWNPHFLAQTSSFLICKDIRILFLLVFLMFFSFSSRIFQFGKIQAHSPLFSSPTAGAVAFFASCHGQPRGSNAEKVPVNLRYWNIFVFGVFKNKNAYYYKHHSEHHRRSRTKNINVFGTAVPIHSYYLKLHWHCSVKYVFMVNLAGFRLNFSQYSCALSISLACLAERTLSLCDSLILKLRFVFEFSKWRLDLSFHLLRKSWTKCLHSAVIWCFVICFWTRHFPRRILARHIIWKERAQKSEGVSRRNVPTT